MDSWMLLFLVGLGVGLCSGLLGIGGGILLVPALLYLPALFGNPHMDMKLIAGLTMAQGFVASWSGILGHQKDRHVSPRLVWDGEGDGTEKGTRRGRCVRRAKSALPSG
jgi:uncharacterized membrane protein YfcA